MHNLSSLKIKSAILLVTCSKSSSLTSRWRGTFPLHCNSSFIILVWIQFFQFTTWWQTYWTSKHFKTGHCKYLQYRFVLIVVKVFAQCPVLIDISDEPRRRKMVRPVPGLCVWWAISFLCLSLLCLLGPAEGGIEACGLVLRSRGFTAHQCVRADAGSLIQHPSINLFCFCIWGKVLLNLNFPSKNGLNPGVSVVRIVWSSGWG